MPRREQLWRTKRLHARLQAEARRLRPAPTAEMDHLREDMALRIAAEPNPLSDDTVHAALEAAEVVLVGDVPALPECQETFTRLVEEHGGNAVILLGAFSPEQGEAIAAFGRGEMPTAELEVALVPARLNGVPLTGYRSLFRRIRKRSLPVVGIGTPQAEGLKEHSETAARVIAHHAGGGTVPFVLDSEMVLHPDLLPASLSRLLAGGSMMRIVQSPSALSWRLLAEGREGQFRVAHLPDAGLHAIATIHPIYFPCAHIALGQDDRVLPVDPERLEDQVRQTTWRVSTFLDLEDTTPPSPTLLTFADPELDDRLAEYDLPTARIDQILADFSDGRTSAVPRLNLLILAQPLLSHAVHGVTQILLGEADEAEENPERLLYGRAVRQAVCGFTTRMVAGFQRTGEGADEANTDQTRAYVRRHGQAEDGRKAGDPAPEIPDGLVELERFEVEAAGNTMGARLAMRLAEHASDGQLESASVGAVLGTPMGTGEETRAAYARLLDLVS